MEDSCLQALEGPIKTCTQNINGGDWQQKASVGPRRLITLFGQREIGQGLWVFGKQRSDWLDQFIRTCRFSFQKTEIIISYSSIELRGWIATNILYFKIKASKCVPIFSPENWSLPWNKPFRWLLPLGLVSWGHAVGGCHHLADNQPQYWSWHYPPPNPFPCLDY